MRKSLFERAWFRHLFALLVIVGAASLIVATLHQFGLLR